MSRVLDSVVAIPANFEDHGRAIWEWRNDVDTRKNSRTMDEVPWNVHVKWCQNVLKTIPETMYMCRLGDENICVVRFSKIDVPQKSNCYEISLNMNPAFRGKRLSSKCITAGMQSFISGNVGKNVFYIIAEIKIGNIQSIKSFIRSGFVHNGLVYMSGSDIEMLQLIFFCKT